jgi:GMP synthase (glutamine-hydrolysing)
LNGFEPVLWKPFAGEAIAPADESVAGSVVYGGPFEAYAYDKYPFLREEARWIETCMRRNIPLLGICQGAQQIAHVLGAPVGPPADESAEFGYYLIEPTEAGQSFLAEPLYVAQSHFHTFGIPSGAVHLARSALFPNQAFSYGKTTFALQFHAEVTIEGFRRWQHNPGTRYDRKGAQMREEQDALMHVHDAAQAKWFYRLLAALFGQSTE